MRLWDSLRSTLEIEVEYERRRLREILDLPDDSRRFDALRSLAQDLGASTSPMYPGHGLAGLPELVHNIHFALQTKAMVAAVRTSSNYFIATVMLAIIALASTVAAFMAALGGRH
jgi:hypothetical protein